jgi:putative ABC transport system ATP-binding protein
MQYLVEARDVYKSYHRGRVEVNAVRGVSLSVRAGELVAIVGPSGSGKSTLLNLLAALDRPDRGEVIIAGTELSKLDDAGRTKLRREQVGLIFQFFNLLPLLSARENVALPMLLGGVPRAQAEKRADELLTRVGLSLRTDHTPDEMSGGEMQRVAVARALGPRPSVLLADEPTGNLDSRTGVEVLALLKSAAQSEGCAVIMVTHDQSAAAAADRIVEFRDGTIVNDAAAPATPGAAVPSTQAVEGLP